VNGCHIDEILPSLSDCGKRSVRKGLSARSWNAENAQGKFDVVVGARSVFSAELHDERTKEAGGIRVDALLNAIRGDQFLLSQLPNELAAEPTEEGHLLSNGTE
jgi:hypothetical protein